MVVSDDAYLAAMRTGVKLANTRGVTSVHDKDGWLGALRLWRQLEERGQLSLARVAVDPARRRRRGPPDRRSAPGSAARCSASAT